VNNEKEISSLFCLDIIVNPLCGFDVFRIHEYFFQFQFIILFSVALFFPINYFFFFPLDFKGYQKRAVKKLLEDSNKFVDDAVSLDDDLFEKSRDSLQISSKGQSVPLLTGAGGSGLFSLYEAFRGIGIQFGSERINGLGVVSWTHAVDDSEYPFDEEDAISKRSTIYFRPIIHVTREPLAAVASLLTCFCGKGILNEESQRYDQESWEFADKHIHFPENASKIAKAIYYWVHWNLLVEKLNPTHRFRLENLSNVKVELFQELAHYYPDIPMYQNKHQISRFQINLVQPEIEVTWEMLEQEAPDILPLAKSLAEKYGYVYPN